MGRYLKWGLPLVIAGVVFYLLRDRLFGSSEKDEAAFPAAAAASNPGIPVDALILYPKTVEDKISITGSISPNESVELMSEVSGKIEQIRFEEGRRVRKGDLLVSLNDDELSAQMERLTYQKKLLEDSEYRQKQLLEREAISREEYDIALTELKTVDADIKLVRAQLDKTKIRAPFSGIIGFRYVSEGSYITPSNAIASLYNNNPVKIEFSIPGKYSNKVQVGDTIRFTTDAIEGFQVGKIYAIEPQVDASTRSLRIKARSDNPGNQLLPGQFTKINLVFSSKSNAIMVPTESVIPELGTHKVFISKSGKAESVEVEIGLRTESQVEIISGLSAKDTLITSGTLQLRPGADVSLNILNP